MLRGAALLLAGVAAGCSSGVSRFTSDMFTTSSTGTQTATAAPANRSYSQAPSALPAAPSGTVQRSAMAPVSMSGGQSGRSSLPPLSPAASDAPMGSRSAALPPVSSQPQPVQVASLPKPAPSLPSTPTRAQARGGSYTVESGDTLSSVSRKTGASVDSIKAANGLSDGNIRIGQTLTVPGAGSKPALPAQAQVAAAAPKPLAPPVAAPAAPAVAPAAPQVATAKPAEAPAQQASYTPPKQTARAIVEDSDAEAPGGTGIGKMRWPVRGKVISNYGKGGGKAGDGIDIAVPEGTPVKAAENGVVIYAGDGLKEFGNTVLVRHENGLVTVYGHASSLKVQRGQTVKRGQELALSGMSGSTESPKLHFEVRKNSSPVDPSTFLE
ncbi:hypothetical protein GCM10016234_10900 [Tianweitania populi]|uniref:LysM domain-containing protein n=3 Tax=Tianweitania TaxID=1763452 RepID=A0A8J3DV33_9HYPH|nr:hypothetical protein GCM10016234_10900 [Tianweitania populi]